MDDQRKRAAKATRAGRCRDDCRSTSAKRLLLLGRATQELQDDIGAAGGGVQPSHRLALAVGNGIGAAPGECLHQGTRGAFGA
jgi:hypothetical protein